MAEFLSAEWRNFADGVITAAEADLLPPTASPRGKNSALTRVAPGLAAVGIRKGITEINPTPVGSGAALIGQFEFKSYASGAFTTYHLLISSAGNLSYKDAATTTAAWDAAAPGPFTSSSSPFLWPDFAAASNCAFICNNTSAENKKAYIESGSRKVRAWGITRPTVGTMAAADGGAGLHNGTYELRVTFRNTRTGHESSASDTATATVTVVDKDLDWTNIPTSADAQVDSRRLWVRNTDTMANFYLAGTIANNSATTATTNILDVNLVVIAPDTAENEPPPTLSVCAWHQSRMFAAGPDAPTTLLYSKLGNPEAFDPDFTELVNPLDGQPIMALHSVPGALLIFKRESTWVLLGDDPNTWEIRVLFKDVGAVSHRSVVTIEGTTYWWSEQGPMAWGQSGNQPIPIGRGLLSETVDITQYAPAELRGMCTVADTANQRILFALPGVGYTRNTLIRPFNYTLQRWDADTWEIIDIASWGVVDDSTSTPIVYLGSYSGQLFKFWDTFGDGVPSGTTSGTVTSSTNTTLTDTSATFVTTGNGVIDRYVYATTGNGLTTQRRRITSHSATALTITPAWTTNPNSTYTYAIGGIDFQWDLSTTDLGAAFHQKRLRHCFLEADVVSATTVYVDAFVNNASTPRHRWSIAMAPVGALYGTGVYGTSVYGLARAALCRFRLGMLARLVKLRVRVLANGKSFTLYKIGLTAERLNENLGNGEGATFLA